MLPLGVARPRPNGWISLKSRIARKARAAGRKTQKKEHLYPEFVTSLNFFSRYAGPEIIYVCRNEGRKEVILPIAIMFLRICWCDTKSWFGIFGRKPKKQKQYFLIPTTHTWNQPKEIILFTVYFYIYIFIYTCIIYIYNIYLGCCFNCSISWCFVSCAFFSRNFPNFPKLSDSRWVSK